MSEFRSTVHLLTLEEFVETYHELKPIVDLVEENLGQKISFFEFHDRDGFHILCKLCGGCCGD